MAIEDLINPNTRDTVKDALRTRAEASGHGKDETGQAFAEVQAVVGRFGRRTVAFIAPVFDAVENNLDSLVGLRQTIPLINETKRRVDDAPGLTKADKRKTNRALDLLLGFVTKHTQFQVRTKQVLKNIVRDKIQSTKQGMIESLKDSPSFITRAIGRTLDNRIGEKAAERKQEILNARAETAEDLAPDTSESETTGKRGKGKGRGGDSWRDMLGTGGRGGGGGDAKGSTRLLGQILRTDKGILKEVTQLNKGQEAAAADEKVEDQAAERAAELGGPTKGTPTKNAAERIKDKGGNVLKDLLTAGVKTVIEGAKSLLSAGAVATVVTAAGAAAIPMAVLAAQAAFFKHMTEKIGDLMQEYPALDRSDKTAADDVQAIVDTKKNVAKVLATEKVLAPEGGFLRTTGDDHGTTKAQDENAERNRLGLNAHEYKQRPGTLYQKRLAREKAGQATATAAATTTPPTEPVTATTETGATAAAQVVPLAPLRLQETLPTPPASKAERIAAAAPEHEGVMHISDAGLDKLRKREGLPKGDKEAGPYHAYPDTRGVWTIGHGLTTINGKPVKKGDVISAEEEKKEMKAQIAQRFEPDVRAGIGSASVSQSQFDAMVSMAYNIGVGARGFSGSTLAKEFKAGREVKQDYFTRWNKAGGVKSAGLVARRNDEFSQFSGGLAPAMASVVPASARMTTPILSASGAASGRGPSVSAPTVVNNYNTTNAQTTQLLPIRPKHEMDTLRALQGVSSIA